MENFRAVVVKLLEYYLKSGLEVDAVQKQNEIDIDNNSNKKQRMVSSQYQKQKAKTKDY